MTLRDDAAYRVARGDTRAIRERLEWVRCLDHAWWQHERARAELTRKPPRWAV